MINFAVLLVVGVIAGQAYADGPEAIVGGNNAEIGQFPHQVSLQWQRKHICGGSIISNRHILTAAHCVADIKSPKSLEILTGTVLSTRKDGNIFAVKCIQMHDKYTGKEADGWDNDIALITLETPIKFDKFQKPIPIAKQDYATGQHRGLISGWGRIFKDSWIPERLQWLEVNVLSEKACLDSHLNRGIGRAFTNPKHICTLERYGQGACQGDSGGPLVVNGELAGVTSWVIPCARNIADVFTKVSVHADWIESAKTKC